MTSNRTTIRALLLLFALALSAAAQQQTGKDVSVADGDALQLTFELIGDTFHQDGRIGYRIKLTNVGKDSITIHKNFSKAWPYSGLQVIVTDTEGNSLPPTVFVEPPSSFHPLTKEDFLEKDFVTLASEASYATTSSSRTLIRAIFIL